MEFSGHLTETRGLDTGIWIGKVRLKPESGCHNKRGKKVSVWHWWGHIKGAGKKSAMDRMKENDRVECSKALN